MAGISRSATSETRKSSRLRFLVFSLTPLMVLVGAAEGAIRLKYYVAHDYDWHFLTTPFPLKKRQIPLEQQMPAQVREALQAAAPAATPAAPPVVSQKPHAESAGRAAPTPSAPAADTPAASAPAAPAAPTDEPKPPAAEPVEPPLVPPPPPPSAAPAPVSVTPAPAPAVPAPAAVAPAAPVPAVAAAPVPAPVSVPDPASKPLAFLWPSPCRSGEVFSTERRRLLPRTWDANCFRGDPVSATKPSGQFRIAFLGGSTVQDFQSDEEMMTAQVRRALLPAGDPRLAVFNAGRAGFTSGDILADYRQRVSKIPSDLVVYYEAWNEQPKNVKHAMRADQFIAGIRNRAHQLLYQRVQLYTYLVEKTAFLMTERGRFWKIDVAPLRRNLDALLQDVRRRGATFAVATQVMRFPRQWKGIDTFDARAVDRLLDRLKSDARYAYDVEEISALNQRLAVQVTVEWCRERGVPVVDIRDRLEALGEADRAELFMDLGHLTVKGDRIVGRWIAEGLRNPAYGLLPTSIVDVKPVVPE